MLAVISVVPAFELPPCPAPASFFSVLHSLSGTPISARAAKGGTSNQNS